MHINSEQDIFKNASVDGSETIFYVALVSIFIMFTLFIHWCYCTFRWTSTIVLQVLVGAIYICIVLLSYNW